MLPHLTALGLLLCLQVQTVSYQGVNGIIRNIDRSYSLALFYGGLRFHDLLGVKQTAICGDLNIENLVMDT